MQLDSLDKYPRRVLRVLLVLRKLEEVQKHATYDGLAYELGKGSGKALDNATVRQAVAHARRLGLVENVETSTGGKGHKAVFGLTDKGREVLRP